MNAAGRKRTAEAYPPQPPQAMPRTHQKPTDKTLPKMMEEQLPDEYKLYNQLRQAEAPIDATRVLRKCFDLIDALNQPLKVPPLNPWLMIVSKENTVIVEYDDRGSALAIYSAFGYVGVCMISTLI
jgi:hypothetical protein